MKIRVFAKQVLGGELKFNTLITFDSKEKYLTAIQKAFQNWKDMHNGYAVIESYSEVVAPKRGFYGITSCSDDFEQWEIINVDFN